MDTYKEVLRSAYDALVKAHHDNITIVIPYIVETFGADSDLAKRCNRTDAETEEFLASAIFSEFHNA